jgi:hypothetical protein
VGIRAARLMNELKTRLDWLEGRRRRAWELKQLGWKQKGGTQGARPHRTHQAVAVLPWLWHLRQEAALRAMASVPLRDWPGAARPVLRLSGGSSPISRPSFPLLPSEPGSVRRRDG